MNCTNIDTNEAVIMAEIFGSIGGFILLVAIDYLYYYKRIRRIS